MSYNNNIIIRGREGGIEKNCNVRTFVFLLKMSSVIINEIQGNKLK